MDADPNTGVAVYDTFDNGTSAPWIQVGGTSLAAPMWAGLIAVANQGRIHNGLSTLDGRNQTLPALYQASASSFHDVTTGSNGGFSAGAGYDFVTGRGTPIADLLVAALAGGSVANVAPVVQTLSASPSPVTAGANITLTASGVSDSDGTVTSLSFYRESNGIAGLQSDDILLGTDSDGSDGWTNISSTTGLSGTYTFYAQAQDNSGALSAAASTSDTVTTSAINQPPVIQSLSGSPNPVSGGTNLTLTASGVSDPDGSVLSVSFYRESNGIAGLQNGSDTLLGNDTSGADGWTNVSASSGLNGTYTYYAQAQDDGGAFSAAVSTNVRVKKNPAHFAVIAAASSPIGSDNLVTTSVADLLGFKPSKSLFGDRAIA